jgi:hypothetical protein
MIGLKFYTKKNILWLYFLTLPSGIFYATILIYENLIYNDFILNYFDI